MILNWLMVMFILFIGVLSREPAKPDVLNVGAICTLNTINGKISKAAIKAAERDVNADPSILGGRKLSINIHDSNFSGFLGIVGSEILLSYI